MNIKLTNNKQFSFKEGLIVLPCYEKELVSFKKLDIPNEVLRASNDIINKGQFKQKKKESHYLNISVDNQALCVILLGMGDKDNLKFKEAVSAFVSAYRKAVNLNQENIYLALRPIEDANYYLYAKTLIRQIILSEYKFNKYKKAEDRENNTNVHIILNEDALSASYESLLEEAKTEADAIIFARDLVNEPANNMTPVKLALTASEAAKTYGYEIDVFDEKQIEKLNMTAYLSVARGSSNPPRLIVLRYKGDKDSDKIYGLIGKGLCYDSGGYSIKPTSSMLDMKNDMAGAATVISAMNLIAGRKLKINVTAVIASCENMIAGNAYKPGDIIYSMDKTSIEIGNTDAEGRLTLADAVTYSIEKENVSSIIELSTLTGGVLIALGEEITGAVTKNDDMYLELKEISKETMDEIWQLPYYEDYMKLLKSDVADINNSGGRMAASITGGLFVTKFAKDTPIVHLDIAGSSWGEKDNPIRPKGATGANVLMIYKYFENKSSL